MFQSIRDVWAARAAHIRKLETRVGDLEHQLQTLAGNVADLHCRWARR
jgi:hypothetical protein